MDLEIQQTEIQMVTPDALSLITKAEIDMQISTAKAFPRSIKNFIDRATSMVTLGEDIAESCIYSLPRSGKNLDGPSIRLAEIVTSSYGNIRSGARVIANDGKTITAQGICHDLETNNSVTVEVKRKITDRNGKTFNEDMQVVTGNAACAVAYRNAVFKVVPAALVSPIYNAAKELIKGNEKTLPAKRDEAVKFFKGKGIKDEQICEVLEIKRIEDIDLEKLFTLRTMATALKNNESTLEEMFSKKETKPAVKVSEEEKELQRLKDHLLTILSEEELDDLEGNFPMLLPEQKALIDEKRNAIKAKAKKK